MSVSAAGNFQEGQVWNYQTRAGEESSRLYIVQIDPHEKLGPIYHIALDGLKLRNPHIEGGLQIDLPHLPISEAALQSSVTQLIDSGAPMPDISEGYGHWKAAFDADEGGIFTIPVAQAVEYIEKAVNQ
ncbi:hypothetical protein [Phytopseudomonas punonensis]|nr:hypothetical protein [Pseudomonas punonensis]